MQRSAALIVLIIATAWNLSRAASLELAWSAKPDPSLRWNEHQRRLSANIDDLPVQDTLAKLSAATGWKIYLDPSADRTVSTRFSDRPTGDALRLLLGTLNFALVPQTNAPSKLLVFKNAASDATVLIESKKNRGKDWIANEVIVTLRKNSKIDIDALAKQLGAKIIGRNDKLRTYRLQFNSDEEAERARASLDGSQDLRIDDNYLLRSPDPSGTQGAPTSTSFNLKPSAVPDDAHTIVAVVDTAVQQLSEEMSQFMMDGVDTSGSADQSQLQDCTPMHGTSMVQTLLSSMSTAARTQTESNVRILPINVYGNRETTSTYDVTLGVFEAVTRGAKVVNLSLGGEGDSPLLDNLIAQAKARGVMFFAAAGNVPTDAPTYPAANGNVFAVTAADSRGNIASYANTGSFIDLIAPGTSYLDRCGQTYRVMGTSPATAIISGSAAFGLSQGQSQAQIESALRSTYGLQR